MKRALHRVERLTHIRQLLLLVTICLVVPVVRILIEDALVVLLTKASKIGVLAEELALQGIRTRDALRCIENVAGVLLSSGELVLYALLIDAGVTCKIRLLGVDLVLDLLLSELGRLVVVLE